MPLSPIPLIGQMEGSWDELMLHKGQGIPLSQDLFKSHVNSAFFVIR